MVSSEITQTLTGRRKKKAGTVAMPAVGVSQILLVIKKVSLNQCQVHLDFFKFLDLCFVGSMPRYINGCSFGFLVWLSASGDVYKGHVGILISLHLPAAIFGGHSEVLQRKGCLSS